MHHVPGLQDHHLGREHHLEEEVGDMEAAEEVVHQEVLEHAVAVAEAEAEAEAEGEEVQATVATIATAIEVGVIAEIVEVEGDDCWLEHV